MAVALDLRATLKTNKSTNRPSKSLLPLLSIHPTSAKRLEPALGIFIAQDHHLYPAKMNGNAISPQHSGLATGSACPTPSSHRRLSFKGGVTVSGPVGGVLGAATSGPRRRNRRTITITVLRFVALFTLLYFFVCSLDFLSQAFRLLGGKAAGEVFSNSDLLKNPVVVSKSNQFSPRTKWNHYVAHLIGFFFTLWLIAGFDDRRSSHCIGSKFLHLYLNHRDNGRL